MSGKPNVRRRCPFCTAEVYCSRKPTATTPRYREYFCGGSATQDPRTGRWTATEGIDCASGDANTISAYIEQGELRPIGS